MLNISNQTEPNGIGNWFLQERWALGHCLRLKQQLPQPLDARAIILWHTVVRSTALSHGLPAAAVSASNSLQMVLAVYHQSELLKKQLLTMDNRHFYGKQIVQIARFPSCNPDPRLCRANSPSSVVFFFCPLICLLHLKSTC